MQKIIPIVFQKLAPLLVLIILTGCSPKPTKERYLKSAESYFASGEFEKAKIEFLNLLRLDPQNATAIQRLGMIWAEQGSPVRALPYLLKSRELTPADVEARTKLALSLAALGVMPESRKEALAILQQSPARPEALLLIADTARTKAEIDETEQYFQKVPDQNSAPFHVAMGSFALRKNDIATAEASVRKALAADPKSVSAHSALATLYMFQKKKAEATEELKAAAMLAPFRSTDRLKYAELKAQSGAVDEAKALLKEMTTKAPDYLPAWRGLAQIALLEKNYAEATTLVDAVFGRDPGDFDTRILHARILMAKGQPKDAVSVLENLGKEFPKIPAVKFQLALAYLQNNDSTPAATALTQAISANPEFTEAILLLGEINLRKGDAPEVATAMVPLLEKRPDLMQARMLLGEAYRQMGRLDDAAAIVSEQIKSTPENSSAHLLLGLILRQQNKSAEARKTLDKALELAPDDLRILSQMIDMDLREKKFDAALARVHAQMAKLPGSAPAQFMEARVYSAQGNWEKAEASLLKTLELDPNFSRAYDLLISTYVSADKLSPALGQLEGLLAKTPDSPRALVMSGMIHEKQKDFAKAGASYEKLLGTAPEFIPALNNLAVLNAERLGQMDKAFDLARKARALKPEDPNVADTLGWILYKRGEYQQALALIQESVGRLPGDPELQFHLGMASYMMGRTDAARTALTEASAAPLEPALKEEIQRKLALLGTPGAPAAGDTTAALESTVAQHPEDIVARVQLGESYEKGKAFDKAAATYEEALKLNPKLISATTKLAQLYAGPLQNKERALALAKRARELSPNDPQAAAVVGTLAYQSGDFKWAYSLLQETARKSTADTKLLHDFAWSAYSMGSVTEAQQAMHRIVNASPDAPEAADAKSFLTMTAIDLSSKDFAAAEPEVQKLLKADASYVPAQMVGAAIKGQSGDAKAAIAGYADILRRLPDFAPAQKQLASLYLDDPATLQQAYDMAMKARRALPEDSELAITLAEISYKRKEYPYAVQLFRESNAKKPLDAKGLFYLGMAHAQAKQKAESREALEKALSAGLQDPLAADAKRKLVELGKE